MLLLLPEFQCPVNNTSKFNVYRRILLAFVSVNGNNGGDDRAEYSPRRSVIEAWSESVVQSGQLVRALVHSVFG